MSFWDPTFSRRKRFVLDLVMLSLCSAALFIIITQLVEPFGTLMAAFDGAARPEASRSWLEILGLALVWGLAWLAFLLLFKALKDDVLGLTAEGPPAPMPAPGRAEWSSARARNALARRRRALQVLRRTVPARRSL